jgi:hypothetical protein
VKLFKANASAVMTVFIGAMIGAALTYLSFAELINNGVSHRAVFGAHFIWTGCAFLILNRLLPDNPFTPNHDISFTTSFSFDYIVINSNDRKVCDDVTVFEEAGTVVYVLQGEVQLYGDISRSETESIENSRKKSFLTLSDACYSTEFLLILIYTNAQILRFNFYIATALTRIDQSGGGTLNVRLLFLFLPLIGSLGTFVVTLMISAYGLSPVLYIAQVTGFVYGLMAMFPGKLNYYLFSLCS